MDGYADRLTPRIMRAMSTINPHFSAAIGAEMAEGDGMAIISIFEHYVYHALKIIENEHDSFIPWEREFDIDYGPAEED